MEEATKPKAKNGVIFQRWIETHGFINENGDEMVRIDICNNRRAKEKGCEGHEVTISFNLNYEDFDILCQGIRAVTFSAMKQILLLNENFNNGKYLEERAERFCKMLNHLMMCKPVKMPYSLVENEPFIREKSGKVLSWHHKWGVSDEEYQKFIDDWKNFSDKYEFEVTFKERH